jgi:hypothetical protein
VRSSIRILSFSRNAGSGDSLAQVRLGGRPVINSKIALSKLIISAIIDEARSSGSCENKADPHFQQAGIGEKAFASGSSGSSTKQTAHQPVSFLAALALPGLLPRVALLTLRFRLEKYAQHTFSAETERWPRFQLVPWRPALEKELGREVRGVMALGGNVDWSLGRKRGLGI